MILFFDTETTGFYHDRLALDHPDQPRLAQIAMMLTENDGTPASMASLIVNPAMEIPEKASEVHGITTARAERLGVQEKTALGLFHFMASRADLVVAHNIKFDEGVMACVAARSGPEITQYVTFCTMEAASPIVNLPPTERMVAAGIIKPKAPKLKECIKFFFDEDLDGAHDALVDVTACARVYFHLKELEKTND